MTARRLATIVADYRTHELAQINEAHIDDWAGQFSAGIRADLLDELCFVFEKTYWSKERCVTALGRIAESPRLTGGNAEDFWRHTKILNIQRDGNSQRELLPLFRSKLREQFGPGFRSDCDPVRRYVYIDDGLFSGGRSSTDLQAWISDQAPRQAELHCVFFVTHSFGEYSLKKAVAKAAEQAGKQINLRVWHGFALENRRAYRDQSDVLWPTAVPQDPSAQIYERRIAAGNGPFVARPVSGYRSEYFSSDERRQLLEREFTTVGARIVTSCAAPKAVMRPLGFYSFGFGFGSMFVSFRNVPNNAPLALWWGVNAGNMRWIPMFRRKAYEE